MCNEPKTTWTRNKETISQKKQLTYQPTNAKKEKHKENKKFYDQNENSSSVIGQGINHIVGFSKNISKEGEDWGQTFCMEWMADLKSDSMMILLSPLEIASC